MPKNNHPPVVLFLYRRPGNALQLLNLIADSGTKRVYVYADGPRDLQDKSATDQVRRIVLDYAKSHSTINFITHFSSKNKGLKSSIVSGLNSVFAKEDSAIILEDDCIPHPDFFPFVRKMLDKYENESRVMSVTGTTVTSGNMNSYDFCKYAQCWGWATWKRSWDIYDPEIKSFQQGDNVWIQKTWKNPVARWYWKAALKIVKGGEIDTWDYQWSYAHLRSGGLVATPSVNLVQNIGFDQLATHTKLKSSVANMEAESLDFPLIHPPSVHENKHLSQALERKFYTTLPALLGMLFYVLRSSLRRIYAR
jgi:hypothetical protein